MMMTASPTAMAASRPHTANSRPREEVCCDSIEGAKLGLLELVSLIPSLLSCIPRCAPRANPVFRMFSARAGPLVLRCKLPRTCPKRISNSFCVRAQSIRRFVEEPDLFAFRLQHRDRQLRNFFWRAAPQFRDNFLFVRARFQ